MRSEPCQTHLLIVEDNKGQREFVLNDSIYTIGKDPASDICLVSRFVSRRHATLVRLIDDCGIGYYRIVDGNLNGKLSAHGLLINGRRMSAHDLQHEDEIVFAPQVRAIYHSLNRPDSPIYRPDSPIFGGELIPPDLPPHSYTLGRFTMISPSDLVYPDNEERSQE